ncbi:MAG TPA: ABC transporter substrate-binding protein, partial [Burkholderiaceae bacterium]|nr:ABC transporter substrate-binding protein [Burkholderiaceae bacterium]
MNRRDLLAFAGLAAIAAAKSGRAATLQDPEPVRLALIEALSGPFANAGEAVFRNLVWAVERVNARGGVKVGAARRPLALHRYDSKGTVDEALSMLKAAIDDGARFILQGNSSAVAAALIDAVNKHNERDPERRVLFL